MTGISSAGAITKALFNQGDPLTFLMSFMGSGSQYLGSGSEAWTSGREIIGNLSGWGDWGSMENLSKEVQDHLKKEWMKALGLLIGGQMLNKFLSRTGASRQINKALKVTGLRDFVKVA